MRASSPAVVALGGGHGLSASLSALRLMTDRITAVVTVADDGGSSGRLRDELGVLPPGDLRMALSALCDDSDWGRTWRDLLQHRFSSSGDLDQHAVGNLLIVALWELLGDTVEGLDWVGKLLGARGRVLPMAAVPLLIEADVVDRSGATTRVVGQSAVAVTTGTISQVRLEPPDPPACPEAVDAIEAADWIVLGPGSWYTSVLPHLLVPGLRDALHRTSARTIVTLNLASGESGETAGMRADQYLDVLHSHAPELRVDAVVADPSAVEDVEALAERSADLGARLLLRQVSRGDGTPRHDPLRLAGAYSDVLDGFLGDVGTRAKPPE
ncbi:gluconeogenesis factor YvcK family protein [Cellulomonas xylanilytica]|uniref:Putative gluconeogenesis factor n=1 Tax=Cellulomonas xylanilytica TaxID=233583 RepID=A0A510V280_9CELL|nr:uridine diphosphate-N-acetylglucosamine-binding protein YvcK [Cellulomonas xylanilytica]GEK20958.1 putative gluconeogenesis factor [Cellulomonas xylanilytica]